MLGLGSNLGDRRRYLRDAVDQLGDDVVGVSPVYETAPMGGPADQQPYLNLVVELATDRTAHELLSLCHRLETAAERVRSIRWGPRTLDVDVLWIDGVEIAEPDLQVPHTRMAERRFVMAPLRDVAPDLVPEHWQDRATGQVTLVGEL